MRKKSTPYLLLIPQMIISLVFLIGLGNGIMQSLGIIPAYGLNTLTLEYYKKAFTNSDLLAAIGYSLKTAFCSAALSCIIGVLICAVIVNRKKTSGGMMRIVQFPIIVPHLVVALFVVNIFSQNGILARCVAALGLISDQSEFPLLIYDQNGVGVILAYFWKEMPFIIYFVMALMANINGRLGEASINLGASRWTTFRKITLPLCMKTILSGFLIIFVFALGAYEMPYLLGATKPRALPVLAYIQYQNPDLRNRPYAMAINGIIIMISLIVVLIYYILIRRIDRKMGVKS